jgi:hypothetical protein
MDVASQNLEKFGSGHTLIDLEKVLIFVHISFMGALLCLFF